MQFLEQKDCILHSVHGIISGHAGRSEFGASCRFTCSIYDFFFNSKTLSHSIKN